MSNINPGQVEEGSKNGDEDEEKDEWDQRIFSTGCSNEQNKMNDCYFEKRDWRACKDEDPSQAGTRTDQVANCRWRYSVNVGKPKGMIEGPDRRTWRKSNKLKAAAETATM
ncbi:MAG: hypothetical protein LQ339_006498 [Xanthoria mediterranea]|nr:MAG: hypothetical protein LQ339_006498 [Xanthoria mediterranea]